MQLAKPQFYTVYTAHHSTKYRPKQTLNCRLCSKLILTVRVSTVDCRVNKVGRITFSVSNTNMVRYSVKVKAKVMVSHTIHKTVTGWPRQNRQQQPSNNVPKHSRITTQTTNSAPQTR